jgi:hypothetical protein
MLIHIEQCGARHESRERGGEGNREPPNPWRGAFELQETPDR